MIAASFCFSKTADFVDQIIQKYVYRYFSTLKCLKYRSLTTCRRNIRLERLCFITILNTNKTVEIPCSEGGVVLTNFEVLGNIWKRSVENVMKQAR